MMTYTPLKARVTQNETKEEEKYYFEIAKELQTFI